MLLMLLNGCGGGSATERGDTETSEMSDTYETNGSLNWNDGNWNERNWN